MKLNIKKESEYPRHSSRQRPIATNERDEIRQRVLQNREFSTNYQRQRTTSHYLTRPEKK